METEPPARPLSVVQILEKNRLTTGSVVQMFQLASGLARRGHRVAVVSRPGGDLTAACRDSAVDFVPLPLRHSFDLGSARGLARLFSQRGVELVHAHKGIAHAISLLATFARPSRPAIVVNRGVSFPLDPFNRLKYHFRLDAVIAVSEQIRDVLVASGGPPAERIHVVHAGVDTARFDPERVDRMAVRGEWGIGDSERFVVQVGARDWKGWRDLLEATRRLADRFPNVRTAVVACRDEEEKSRVAGAARSLGIADRVLTIGFRMDMPEVLSAADVVADLSYAGTGITGTIREAMALGRPVVATAVGGNPELVEPEVSGLLVPPRDPAAAAEAISRLLADPGGGRHMGEAARERVRREFSVERRLDRIEALYRRIIAGRARGSATAGPRGRAT
ncbi:MAG: glycosyltransferase family 4 protein [Thermoanaerobaculia bacterium]